MLNTVVGKEICATIEVIKGKDEEAKFLITADDIYESAKPSSSTSQSSHQIDFPAIDLSEVSIFPFLLRNFFTF